MKAITYQKTKDQFSLSEISIPSLETAFDVLVKVEAVGLNPVDSKIYSWHEMVADMDDNFVGGLDVAGEIIATGEAVKNWKIGDKVLYHGNMRRAYGGFAEYAVQDGRSLIAFPAFLSAEEAASIPCAAWTAYRALTDKLNISQQESLLIMGAAGGVGSFAIQLAKIYGVKTIITTASSAKHSYVKSLGASHVIDYQNEDVLVKIMEITAGKGVRAALDCVGGENDKIAAAALGFEGHMVELVQPINAENYSDAFLKGLSFHQLSLGSGHVNGESGRQSLVNAGQEVSSLLKNKQLKPPQLQVISLKEIGDALMEMRKQRTIGKIVAKI